VRSALARFPNPSQGFLSRDGRMYQAVFTPVYVDSGGAPALLNVLLAGYLIDEPLVRKLKEATGGSEFAFCAGPRLVASTLGAGEACPQFGALTKTRESIQKIQVGNVEYLALRQILPDVDGRPIGEVWILRSYDTARAAVRVLRRDLIMVWIGGALAALAFAWFLARALTQPIARLDRAAAEVSSQNYDYRLPVTSNDELGRLSLAFNRMCESLQRAKSELIRQERLGTISRLSSSLVHDLRNPLAAIYAGSEMLADGELPQNQVQRLGGNIHRASSQIQLMLQELIDVSRGRTGMAQVCELDPLIRSAWDMVASRTPGPHFQLLLECGEDARICADVERIKRVFVNLFANAIEAMPQGGDVRVRVQRDGATQIVDIEDTGSGVAPEVRDRLFEPFAASTKRNGMGIGLALSRQAIADHGGDLWLDSKHKGGARFVIRLPGAERD
jgi:signal transduction histidine kinase